MKQEKKFAFLGDSFFRFIVLIIIAMIGLVAEKVLNYRYVVVQKAVQGGEVVENWQRFLKIAAWIVIASLVLTIIKCFFIMWVEKVQSVNFFKVYNGLIQEDGKLQGCSKKLTVANAQVRCVIDSAETIINSAYVVLLMGVVTLSVPERIWAAAILVIGISLGFLRGRLQGKTDLLGVETNTLKQKLSNFFMISSDVLDERVDEISGMYWKRIGLQCIKNAIQILPDVVKVMAFIALFYNITMAMAEGEVYPYAMVVFTIYNYMVNLASNISNLIESISKIVLYKRDPELKDIEEEIVRREKEILDGRKCVKVNSEGIIMGTNFTTGLTRPNGEMAFYKVPQAMALPKGGIILLEGENGTGKSRLCKLLKEILPGTISYDVKTAIVENYHENFKRRKSNIDFNLVKYLAEGLELDRVPKNKKEFFELNCSQINSADRQMLVALQILYMAIKNAEEGKMQLIILDEIFGNLSLGRTQKVLPFMTSELKKIGACTILVSHSHKEEVKKYTSSTWQMCNNGRDIIIKAE